jgi:hypothetical protein
MLYLAVASPVTRRMLEIGRRAAILAALLCSAVTASAQQSPDPVAPPVSGTADERRPIFDEPSLLGKAIARAEKFNRDGSDRPKDGFYPELGHMITGAGWISVGPGYRKHVMNGRALVDGSAAISWRAYKIAQGSFELPALADDRLAVGVQGLWQDLTQVRYFGVGQASQVDGVSDYRIKTTNVIGYAAWRANPSLSIGASAGWLNSPTLLPSGGSFDRKDPDTLQLYAFESAASLVEQPSYAHGGVAATFDTRDHAGYPTRGLLAHASTTSFRDRESGTYSFDRVELEAARFISIADERGVIALHGWSILTHTAGDRQVPFYLLPSLGGHDTLRGYADYRFHDRHLLLLNVESRWALFRHLDGAVFVDAGNVAARVGDLDLARRSVGAGVRVHTAKSTIARFDVAHGAEGWRFMLKISDPLRLARLSTRTAPIPFVP